MDEIKESSVFSKGINFQELMSTGTEFHIDVDFRNKNTKGDLFSIDGGLLEEESEGSDADDILKKMEQKVAQNVLLTPENMSFSDLATKMVDCLPSGAVKILIHEEGDGPLVATDAQVVVHYSAYWKDEKIPFDSTYSTDGGNPKTFQLGTNSIIPGLEIGLTTVKGPAARFTLLIQPELAWGGGVMDRIRPEPCLFVVQLIAVKEMQVVERFNDLPSEEQRKFSNTLRTTQTANQHAKDLFMKKSYAKATTYYLKSLSVLQMSSPQNDDEMSEIKKLLCNTYVNLAVCYSKMNKPHKILLMCDDLGKITNINAHCKGLYYYGKAFFMLGQYDDAQSYYNKALQLEPKNKEIGKAMADLNDVFKRAAVTEKQIWRKAFHNTQQADSCNDVDEEFKINLKQTFEDLANRDEFTKIEMPKGLLKREVKYMKMLAKDFEKIVVDEDCDRKKLYVIKKM